MNPQAPEPTPPARRRRWGVRLRRLFWLGVLFFSAASCVRARTADFLPLTPPAYGVIERELSLAGSEAGARLEGHLARPAAPGRFPCAVLLHGKGGWWRAYESYAHELAERGVAALILDYYSAHYVDMDGLDVPFADRRRQFDLQNEDIARAVAAFASGPDCAAGKVGLVGFSLGADKAFRAAAARPEVRAVVAYYGPYDYASFIRHRVSRVLLALAGEEALRWKDYLEQTSPIFLAERVRGDALLFHGVEDSLIPMKQSVEMHAALLRRKGYGAWAVYYEATGHNFVLRRRSPAERTDSLRRTLAFLLRSLPPAEPAVNGAGGAVSEGRPAPASKKPGA